MKLNCETAHRSSPLLPLVLLTATWIATIGSLSAAHSAEPADIVRLTATSTRVVVDHSGWTRLLKTYVRPTGDGLNRVDYAAFKKSGHDDLNLYIQQMDRIDPYTLSRAEQFALLANVYNAKTISIVLDRYPVKSIRDISLAGGLFAALSRGPWKAKVLKIRGVELSLDDIEHGILRTVFKDPRVHYAVNCASIGCPNLQAEALTGAKLGSQLDAGARMYINHSRGVKIADDQLVASSIYDWFKADFSEEGVLAHLRKYAAPDLAAKLKDKSSIAGYQYDWALNDARR